MHTLSFSQLFAAGDLGNRALLNYNRLEMAEYQPENVFKDCGYDWPGDNEGRTILALVLLARSTHREPKYLQDIMAALPEYLNKKGYFGKVLPDGLFDEQQLSGNSWFLRALVEYYLWKKDIKIFNMIKQIVDSLLLPAKGYYTQYPSNPEERILEGEAIGSLSSNLVGSWYISTDIGCAFIMLDGATHAYQLLHNIELKELIDEMIESFISLDILNLSLQTHATLSALRGILRYYEMIQDSKLLKLIEKIYLLYKEEAITENFANYNWFRRPHWTEPCAIIDSFIVAVELWKHTKTFDYLEDAHNILFNAIYRGQRPNGGFGSDTCSGAYDEFLSSTKDFEAFWCCTMRGGEGLAKAIEYSYFQNGDETIVPFYNENTAKMHFTDGDAVLRQTTGYPIYGYTMLEVIKSDTKTCKTVKLYIPSWIDIKSMKLTIDRNTCKFTVDNGFIVFQTEFLEGKKVELVFDIRLRKEVTINKNSIKGYHTYRHGVLILGLENSKEPLKLISEPVYLGEAKYRIENSELELSPINNQINSSMNQAKESRMQILFK